MSGDGEVMSPAWYYVADGATRGPVPAQTIRAMIASGQLGPADHVRHVAWSAWWRVNEAADALGLDRASLGAPAHRPSPASQGVGAPAAPGVVSLDVRAGSGLAAPLTARAGGWAVDVGVLVLGLVVSNVAFGFYPPLATLVMVTVALGYLVILPALGVGRLGHRLMGLEVVDSDTLGAPSPPALAARGLVVVLLAAPMLIGAVGSAFNVLISDQRLAWHDLATGTMVVRRIARP